ncbi:hypothetical protein, partial [Thauera propionica]|uniref:hypothetical protein n=1 Tax=Thauera propionica TaxID=2019431 RepID=UPI0023F3134C
LALAHPLAPDVIRAVSEQIDTLLGSNQMTLRDLMPALNLTLREAPALITAGVLEADLARFVLNGRALVRAANGSLRHLELLPLEEVKP